MVNNSPNLILELSFDNEAMNYNEVEISYNDPLGKLSPCEDDKTQSGLRGSITQAA